MTLPEIVRELRRISYSPSIAELSRRAGLNRDTVFRVIRSGQASSRVQSALDCALRGVVSDPYHNRPASDQSRGARLEGRADRPSPPRGRVF